MKYFTASADDFAERLGKVIGDAFASLIYLSIIVLMFSVFLR
jgi:hypothetical protein